MAIQHRLIPVGIAGIVAAVGIWISILSLAAAITDLPAVGTIDRLRRGDAVLEATIIKAADSSLKAGNIFEPSRYNSDALLALARLTPANRADVLHGRTYQSVTEDALVASPSSPHNWARRAAAQLAANDVKGAYGSIEMSLMLGRFVPGLTVPRMRIMLGILLRAPSAELDRQFAEQARMAARIEADDLGRFADGGAAEGRVQRILSNDFTLYSAYLRSLNNYRASKALRKAPR